MRQGYGHRDLWNAEAERYSRASTARFEDDGFLKILAACGVLSPEVRLLDLGCGPGIYSVAMAGRVHNVIGLDISCLLYTSPSPRDKRQSRMPS